jgi:ankyrin repeat protein
MRAFGTAQRCAGLELCVAMMVVVLSGCSSKSKKSQSSENATHNTVIWAAMAGDLDLLKKLDAEGQDLNAQLPQAFNWSPLIASVYHDHPAIIAYLISRKVQLDVMDAHGETALMWAMKMEDTNTVWLLLEAGADVAVTNQFGGSAFGYVDSSVHRETFKEWLTSHNHPSQ